MARLDWDQSTTTADSLLGDLEAGTHCTGPFFEHFCRSGNGRPSISFILDPYFLSCFCFCIFSVQWDGKVLKFL